MDRWDLKDSQEKEEQVVYLDLKEALVILVVPVHKGYKALEEVLEDLALLGKLDPLANEEFLELMADLANKDLRDYREHQAFQEVPESVVCK